MIKDYYKILEVSFGCTNNEIKKSYRTLALKYHPDRNDGNKIYEEKFKLITEAYDILSNVNRRIIYDNEYEQNIKQTEYKKESPITPSKFLNLFIDIKVRLKNLGNQNMYKSIVYKRVIEILDKTVIEFLLDFDDKLINKKIISEVKQICKYLNPEQIKVICLLLSKIAANDNKEIEAIYKFQKSFKIYYYLRNTLKFIINNFKLIILLLFIGWVIYGANTEEKNTIKIEKPNTGDLTNSNNKNTNSDSLNYYLQYKDWDTKTYETGVTPECYSCKSRNDFEVETSLNIVNNSAGDVVVKLIRADGNKCIRYVYIRKDETFEMKYIPLGKYYYKVGYGTDWRQKYENGRCVGKFIGKPAYKNSSKDGEYFDFEKQFEGNIVRDGENYKRYSYNSFELTLTTVYYRTNDYSKNVSEEEFNNDN